MLWSPKDQYQIALPIIKIWKYTGFPVYRVNSSSQVVQNKSRIVYIVILTLTVKVIFNIYSQDKFGKSVEDLTNLYKSLVSCSQTFFLIIICHRKSTAFSRLFNDLSTIEMLIYNMTHKQLPLHKSAKYFLGIVLTKMLLMITSGISDLMNIYESTEYIQLVTYYLSWFYDYFTEILLIFFLVILKQLYGELREHINIAQTFGLILLAKYMSDFLFCTTSIFYTFYIYLDSIFTAEQNIFQFLIKIVAEVVWIPVVLITDFYIALFFEDIMYQHDLFLLRMKTNQLYFTVCNLFPLNSTLIYTVGYRCANPIVYNYDIFQMISGMA
ncbi:hypothetical protein BDFB_008953, partial [Asbolus verrucosus]